MNFLRYLAHLLVQKSVGSGTRKKGHFHLCGNFVVPTKLSPLLKGKYRSQLRGIKTYFKKVLTPRSNFNNQPAKSKDIKSNKGYNFKPYKKIVKKKRNAGCYLQIF